ncbi:class I SAM-dependent methyltransferase [Streptomyces sp. NBC_01013]|nr:class I SAM-dependent methyltransferase [Streptomyces sp. NBC_01013]
MRCATPSTAAYRSPRGPAWNSAQAPACSPGLFTPLPAAAYPTVISLDLSEQMLRQAAGRSRRRVRADAGRLALPDASVAAVATIDMLLYPTEAARVLAPEGVLLWINQLGEDGPLYLPTDAVAAALPGSWQATQAAAGWGSWAILHRT